MDWKINEYITLKLERNGDTVIYVGGEKFLHCSFILLNITHPEKSGSIIDQIDSVDEAAELLDDVLHENAGLDEPSPEIKELIQKIDPETKFWAHCSNLQVWVENEYDTRLLHSNLSFPLLKRLTELGDPVAKKVFKEEIMMRFYGGVESVMGYLCEEGYLEYLTKEDMYSVVQDDHQVLHDIEKICGKYPAIVPRGGEYSYPAVLVNEGRIIAIKLYCSNIKEAPESFRSLSKLQEFNMGGTDLEIVPDWIGELNQLIKLDLHSNRIKELQDSIRNLRNLENLNLSNNKLTKLPPSITKLRNLKELVLYDNELTEIPEGIGSLTSLKKFYLERNGLEKLPESIGDLKELEYLGLSNNNLVNIPTTISNLKKLEVLELSRNPINELPERMDSLESLEHLSLYETNIEKLPESIFLLPKLKIIDIRSTLIKEIPQALQEKSKKIRIWLQE